MSFHRLRRDRWLDNDPHWERIMLKGVTPPREAQPAQGTRPPTAQRVVGLRRADPINYLLPASEVWLESLQPEVRPIALAATYARIVNLLALHWYDRDACAAFFNNLFVDRRGDRQGFPAAVKSEIRILQEYFLRSPSKSPHDSTLRMWPGGDAYSR